MAGPVESNLPQIPLGKCAGVHKKTARRGLADRVLPSMGAMPGGRRLPLEFRPFQLVDGRTCGSLLTTRDTVFIETPARPATSNTVAFIMTGCLTSQIENNYVAG